MRLPSPSEYSALTAAIMADVLKLDNRWTWTRPSAFHPPKYGGERTRGGGTAKDGTPLSGAGQTAASTEGTRDRLEGVVRITNQIWDLLSDAHKLFDQIDHHTDKAHPHSEYRVAEVAFIGSAEHQNEVQAARDSKERRDQRAKESGDFTEVTG